MSATEYPAIFKRLLTSNTLFVKVCNILLAWLGDYAQISQTDQGFYEIF